MNVIDSSAWLAYFAGTSNADNFAKPIQDTQNLIVPAICVYEVTKVILRESDENHLLQALAVMQQGRLVELSHSLATTSAKLSTKHKLPMADSIIYATAVQLNATVWTQDVDFQDLPNVRYFAK